MNSSLARGGSEVILPSAKTPLKPVEGVASAKDANPKPTICFAHLDEAIWPLVTAPIADRVRHVLKDRVVKHDKLCAALNAALWLGREPMRSRARGVIVSGMPGAGKTTLGDLVKKAFPQVRDPKSLAPMPMALMISLTGARDTRTVYGRILEAFDAPVGAHQRVADREMIALRILHQSNCRLLILDEVQDVLSGSEREQKRALSAVKFLMNELHLPILALGTDAADRAFCADAHLSARFRRMSLPQWEASTELLHLLSALERWLPLKKASDLRSPSAVAAILRKGNGSLDSIVQTVNRAAVLAIQSGIERITVELIEKSDELPTADILCEAA